MINGQTVLAVIPARGGSKRCPRKNIRPFRGKPLIQWTIDAALASKYIDLAVVSTEDQEIADAANRPCQLRLSVLKRPPELATDTASSEDVCRHVAETFHWRKWGWVVLLQPTSPLRVARDIDTCIELAQLAKPCISYSTTLKKHGGKNGAVYVASTQWLKEHDFSGTDHSYYIMADERSLDIDTEEELAA